MVLHVINKALHEQTTCYILVTHNFRCLTAVFFCCFCWLILNDHSTAVSTVAGFGEAEGMLNPSALNGHRIAALCDCILRMCLQYFLAPVAFDANPSKLQ